MDSETQEILISAKEKFNEGVRAKESEQFVDALKKFDES